MYFEIATKKKFRFPYKGLISVEDLWDLSPEALDHVYNKLVKEHNEECNSASLLDHQVTEKDEEFNCKVDIVRYIFNLKMDEIRARKLAAANAEKKRKILDILAKKQDEALCNMSEEELVNMLNEMNAE